MRNLTLRRFNAFAEWNQKSKTNLNLVLEILARIFNIFQKKNQRNEHRLSFVRAYFNAFLEDLSKSNSHQVAFAEKTIQSFGNQEKITIPIFEQGIHQLLVCIQESGKKLPELRQSFEKTIMDPLTKALTRHAELYSFIEKCAKGFEHYKELYMKAAKEYENYVNIFNSSMTEGKKKNEKDVFTEAHKYSSAIQNCVIGLVQICDDLTKMRAFALAKEQEYLKAFSKSFKDFALFSQQHFGQLATATLQKSRFLFDAVTRYLLRSVMT